MKSINEDSNKQLYSKACIAMIWLIVFYSSIIQYVYMEIPNAMLIIGAAILLLYCLANSGKPFDFQKELTEESIYMLLFMIYMFIIGILVAIDRKSHISQAMTSLQFLFILIMISSLIKGSGTETFHLLLLVKALVLAAIFLSNPVPVPGGRYSISADMNPNGLGMTFATGIWAVLYRQQKKRLPLILVGVLIALFGYCIFKTGSRKSLIASGLTIALWLFFCFLPSIREKGGIISFLSFLVMIVLILVISREFILLYSDSTISNRMDRLLYETTEGNRSQMYRAGLEMIKDNPVFGIGFQGFKSLYGLYSHSTIIEIPVSSGIIGTILFFYTYFVSLRKTFWIYRKTKKTEEYIQEHIRIRMIIPLWAAMLFYSTCIIHLYMFDSFVIFGIIFGETAYIESKLLDEITLSNSKAVGSKYIKLSGSTALPGRKVVGSKYIKCGE